MTAKKFPIEKETSLSIPSADLCLKHSLAHSAVNKKTKKRSKKVQVGSSAKHKACDTRGQCSLVILVVVQNYKSEKSASPAKALFKNDHSFEKLEVYGTVC